MVRADFSFRSKLVVGIPVPQYEHGQDDRTATDEKNGYKIPVLYTQLLLQEIAFHIQK